MPARLSVNINKIALLRNSRGRDVPSLPAAIDAILLAGAHGITIHPRLDERHVRRADVPAVAAWLREHHAGVELNVECEPDEGLIDAVIAARAAQCTLVPVRPGEVTSDHGWRFPEDSAALAPAIRRLRDAGVRVSLFTDCEPDLRPFADIGADRVELYTGPYAWAYGTSDQERERARVFSAAEAASRVGLGLNAGHDLDRHNLLGLRDLPGLDEVSIGHAWICRALEVGMAQSTRELLNALG